jgi:PiT family inorganic phosphate transporter
VIALAMATGGLLGARRVAETMSKKISNLDPSQGLVASLTTATLVIAASTFALPVSTTHVATGGILGIGVATATTRWRTVKMIVGAWVTTLPLGAALGAIAFAILRGAR